MTTEYTRNQSPRLPANYPAHVERVLSKKPTRDNRLLWLAGLLAVTATAFAYGLLSA